MTDFDIGSRHQHQNFEYGDKDKANISIKHTTGHHSHNVTQRDQIQSSTNTYKEEFVPPVDTPVLESADTNASNKPPQEKPQKPDAKFKQNFERDLHHLPESSLRSLKAGSLPEARAMLRFAQANPEVKVNPQVRELSNALSKLATQQTQSQMKLGSDWKPEAPSKEEFNAHITEKMNSNFTSLLNTSFKGADAKALLLTYYHPEFREQLSPELQHSLNELTQMAYKETQKEEGFPPGWQPPPDSSALDDLITANYDRAFDEQVAEEKNLSPQERKELRTLHRFPSAKVPDKEKLEHLLKAINEKAHAATKKRFGLPGHFKMRPNAHAFKLGIMGGFGAHFQKHVLAKLRNGEISHEQAQRLIASKGVDPAKVPANLHAVYTQLRQSSSKDTAKEYGLPDNWEPSSSDASSGETSSSATAGKDGTVRNADGSVRIKANTAVKGKTAQTNQSEPIDPLTAPASGRDNQTAIKAVNYYRQAMTVTSKIVATYFTGPQVMLAGDSMLAVAEALDNLRDGAYGIQTAEARAARAISRGQNDAQEEKFRKQLADMQKAPPKEFFLFKIFAAIPIIGKQLEQAFKLMMWAVNVLLGGMVNMITQAIGMQPIEENPLQMLGWISEAQAEKMDMALGIIVMVAEMAVSAVIAQPELIMGEIAMMTAEISEATAAVSVEAAEIGVDAAGAASKVASAGAGVAAGVAEVAGGVGSSIGSNVLSVVEKVVQKVSTELAQEVAKAAVKVGTKQVLKQGAQNATRQAAQKITSSVLRGTGRIFRNIGQKMFEQGIKEPIKSIINAPMKIFNTTKNILTNLGEIFSTFGRIAQNVGKGELKAAMDAIEELEGIVSKGAKGAKTAAAETAEAEANAVRGEGEGTGQADRGADAPANETTPAEEPAPEVKVENQAEEVDTVGNPENGGDPGDIEQTPDEEATQELQKQASAKASMKETPNEATPPQDPTTPTDDAVPTEETPQEVPDEQAPTQEESPPNEGAAQKEINEKGGKPQTIEERNRAELAEKTKMRGKEVKSEKVGEGTKAKNNDPSAKKDAKITADAQRDRVDMQKGDASKQIKTQDADSGGSPNTSTGDKSGRAKGAKQAKQETKKVDETKNESKSEERKSDRETEVGGKTSSEKANTAKSKEDANSVDDDPNKAQAKRVKKAQKQQAERAMRQFQFMMDIKDYMQNAMSFAAYTGQAIMYIRRAKADMKAAEDQAFIQEMDAYIEMEKKAEAALQQSMGEMAGWINDINQQESMFWKKMEIRYIAA